MSTGKTTHLGLNQWEPEDSFLWEEFNEDNRRLDAAFAGPRLVKLLEVTTQAAAAQVDLAVGEIPFSDYWKVLLYFDIPVSTTGVFLRVNGLSEGYGMPPENAISNGTGSYLAVFQSPAVNPFFYELCAPRPGMRVSGRGGYFYCTKYSSHDSYTGAHLNGMAPVTWGELESFNFVCSASIPAGSRFLLLGVSA